MREEGGIGMFYTVEEQVSAKLGYRPFFTDCNEFGTREELDERVAVLEERHGKENVRGAMSAEDTMYVLIVRR